MLKVVIFGASGIIGQHLRLCVPDGIEPVWVRKEADPLHLGLDLTDATARDRFLQRHKPDVIINLAGESRPDVVERDPERYRHLNLGVPSLLSAWCDGNNAHFVHVSSQAVFSGDGAPYSAGDSPFEDFGINAYGRQKQCAESASRGPSCTIVRPTFVMGVRPLPFVGRENPVEQMLSQAVQKQVGDRWFSVSFASDVAKELWNVVTAGNCSAKVRHIGIPFRVNRWELANHLTAGVERVSHDDFPGLAPRPIDTTYAGQGSWKQVTAGLQVCQQDFVARKGSTLEARAREIALFMGEREDACLEHLNRGFGTLHGEVRDSFNAHSPVGDIDLLNWYRDTDAYIWELSAYHCHPGFNYSGMCQGVAERLKAAGSRKVLCLGDGIGDLTLSLIQAGFDAHYHDLAGSRTAEYAQFRFWTHLGKHAPTCLTSGWKPELGRGEYDAVISFDFLEHVTDVPAWTLAIREAIVPGGLMLVQNAFNCGSGPEGSIPMHLSRNDRFEKDWTPLMQVQGFLQEGESNWYRTPGVLNGDILRASDGCERVPIAHEKFAA